LSRAYDAAPGTKGRYAGFKISDATVTGTPYTVSYGYDTKGRMNKVSWNVNNVLGATDYTYVPGSILETQ
jgi:hypothetical protein